MSFLDPTWDYDAVEIERVNARLCEFVLAACSFGLLLISSVGPGVIGDLVKLLWLGSMLILCRVNIGSAFGVFIASVSIYAVRVFEGSASPFQRPDNFAMLVIIGTLVFAGARTPFPPAARRLSAFVLVFIAYLLVQMAAFGVVDRGLFAWCMRMFGLPLILFLLFWKAKLSSRELRGLCNALMIFTLYDALVSIFESLGWYSLLVPRWIGDPASNLALEFGRVGGPFLQSEWNGFALSLLFCVPFIGMHEASAPSRIARYILLGLCGIAIYLTYTRAAWIALTLAALKLLWQLSPPDRFRTVKRLAMVCAVVCAVALASFSGGVARDRVQDFGTIYYRFNLWAAGLDMASARPLFGYGFGQFQQHVAEFQTDWATPEKIAISGDGNVAHNTLVNILVEQGLIGFTLYMFIAWQVVRQSRLADLILWPTIGTGWIAAFCLAYAANALFIVAFEPTTNYLFFGMLGMIVGLARREEPGTRALRLTAFSTQQALQ